MISTGWDAEKPQGKRRLFGENAITLTKILNQELTYSQWNTINFVGNPAYHLITLFKNHDII